MPARYSSSWKPLGAATLPGLPYLPCLSAVLVYGRQLPQDQRGGLDRERVWTLLADLAPEHDRVVFDLENLSPDDPAGQKRIADLLAWCAADFPGIKVGLYGTPGADLARNIRAGNDWFGKWLKQAVGLSMAPWFTAALICPSLYAGDGKTPVPLDDDWAYGADYSLKVLRRLFPGREIVAYVYPTQAAHMDWLTANGWDCAVWEA